MTQDSDIRPRSVIREEATLALESCRPFPAFEKVASVLSPDQFACFYCNYTSANLKDVLTFCGEDLTGDWDTPAMVLGLSKLNRINKHSVKEELPSRRASFNFRRPLPTPEVTVTCIPSNDHPTGVKKLPINHKSRRTRWRTLKRFITCQNKFVDSLSTEEMQDRSYSSMLSSVLYNEDDGWIKTNPLTPYDNCTQSTNSNERPSSLDGGTSMEGGSARWNPTEEEEATY